jgi:DNA-binding MarR family transcriptional regulator
MPPGSAAPSLRARSKPALLGPVQPSDDALDETAPCALNGEPDEAPEELLQRIARPRSSAAEGPLTWDDIAFLVQGMAFAPRPLTKATQGVTRRHGLGPRGAWILDLISADIAYPHELARVFGIGRSLISAEISRLLAAGLIESEPGRDRRRTRLLLTAAGRSTVSEIRRDVEATIRQAMVDYTPDDVRLCARMLRDLRENRSEVSSGS